MYAHYIIYLIRFLVGLDGYVRNYFQYLIYLPWIGGVIYKQAKEIMFCRVSMIGHIGSLPKEMKRDN